MSSIIKKFIGNDQVGATKVRLENNSSLRARNAANSADINLLTLSGSNVFQVEQDLSMNTHKLLDAYVTFRSAATDPGTPTAGDVYFNTSASLLKFYNGLTWGSISSSPLTTKGDLYSFGTTNTRLPVGTNGQILSADSAETTGLKWISAPVTGANTALSNLASVSINTDLIFATGLTSVIKSSDNFTTDSQGMWVKSGDTDSADQSGDVHVESGAGGDISGTVKLTTAAAVSQSGGIQLSTGSAPTRGKIRFVDGTQGTSGYVWTSVNTFGDGSWMPASGGGGSPGSTNGAVQFNNGGAFGGDASTFFWDDTNKFLGLGTNTPSAKLHLATTGLNVFRLGTDAGVHFNLSENQLWVKNGAASADLYLQESSTGNIFLVTGGGSVGIGVYSPTAQVHTTGTMRFANYGAGASVFDSSGNLSSVAPGTSGNVLKSNGTTWISAAASGGSTNNKELFTLSATDITNQYIDLTQVALTNSIDFLVKGGSLQIEGASYDYSVNYTGGVGGKTRITFLNDLATGGAAALIAGDVVVVKYQY